MSPVARLTKTTIVIWTDPTCTDTSSYSIEDLAYEASRGDAYCSRREDEVIANPTDDPAWDGTEFFDECCDD